SDGDGYSDLEERARGSDPLDATSIPEPSDFALGTCASQENGFVTTLSIVYAKTAVIPTLDLRFGLVYHGRAFLLSPDKVTYLRGSIYSGHDPDESLAAIEVGIPMELLQRFGQVNFFCRLKSSIPGSDVVVGILPIASFSGIAMSIEPHVAGLSSNGGSATG